MTEYSTMILDVRDWDILLDSAGNWAVADPPYAPFQDAASSAKVIKGEAYITPSRGVAYPDFFKNNTPSTIWKSAIEKEMLRTPGVVDASVIFSGLKKGMLIGEATLTLEDGTTSSQSFIQKWSVS